MPFRREFFHWTIPFVLKAVLLTSMLLVGYRANAQASDNEAPFVIVLGIAQDGGFPQAGCQRDCCRLLATRPELASGPTCLAIIDPKSGQRWMLECTPDFPGQLAKLNEVFPVENTPGIDGILLTHAHIGHYAGLIHLGREVMGTRDMPVYVMPRMQQFLRDNGPWSQLVDLNNIELRELHAGQVTALNDRLKVTPIIVPHRDEFSETVGFEISGPNHSIFFLPDIDKWERWETAIETVVQRVDFALLDATFFDDKELPGRDMSQIPHPFVVDSIRRFQSLDATDRSKIRFIHLNHSNPALVPDSDAAGQIRRAGMNIAGPGDRLEL